MAKTRKKKKKPTRRHKPAPKEFCGLRYDPDGPDLFFQISGGTLEADPTGQFIAIKLPAPTPIWRNISIGRNSSVGFAR
jgi:hypothetical protein